MESLLCCPLCGAALERTESRYVCPARHSFDIAREGYSYLLPVNRKHSAAPGDDPGMAAARRDFLSKGYYHPLLDALCALAVQTTGAEPDVLDAGCGEGYYTSGIYRALCAAEKRPRMAGADISKAVVRLAAKREKAVEFAVASSYRLPLADGSVDLLLNCFSPLALEEFRRILKPGGLYFYVVPGERHLWQLKEILYENPYPNTEKITPYEGFTYLQVHPIDTTIHLPDQETISDLFQMTPYFWKTPKSGTEKLAALNHLDTEVSFRVHVYRRG